MESFQVTVLKGAQSFLEHLDAFIAAHSLLFVIGITCLMIAVVVFVIVTGLCRKSPSRKFSRHIPPPIIIETEAPSRPPEDDFQLFPPPHYWRERERDPDEQED